MECLRHRSFNIMVFLSLVIIVLSGLFPAPLAKSVLLKQTAIVKARHTKNDPASFHTNIKINGISIGDAMVDTGASDTAISIENANKAKLVWHKGEMHEYVLADNSVVVCYLLRVTINTEGVVRRAPVAVCPEGDTLLGMSFLNQTKLHLEKGVMTFR